VIEMRKKKLEMILSNLEDMADPKPELEQYATPSEFVSSILMEALSRGDIEGRKVCELGCGSAPFAIGAWLLGASEVLGIDLDEQAVRTAKNNIERTRRTIEDHPKGEIEFMVHDLNDPIPFRPRFDTVLMNPPFGSQTRYADRPFIKSAMEISSVCYSIHNGNSLPFLERLTQKMEVKLEPLFEYDMDIPHRFHFHSREVEQVRVVVVRFFKE